MASEIRGRAAESAELPFAPGADHDQTGLIARGVVDEGNAWIAVSDGDGVLHAESPELLERFFGIGSDLVIDAIDVSRRPFATRRSAANDRGRYTQIRTEPGRP